MKLYFHTYMGKLEIMQQSKYANPPTLQVRVDNCCCCWKPVFDVVNNGEKYYWNLSISYSIYSGNASTL